MSQRDKSFLRENVKSMVITKEDIAKSISIYMKAFLLKFPMKDANNYGFIWNLCYSCMYAFLESIVLAGPVIQRIQLEE